MNLIKKLFTDYFSRVSSLMSVDELHLAVIYFHPPHSFILIFNFPICQTLNSLFKSPFPLTVHIIDSSQRCFYSDFDSTLFPPPAGITHLASLIDIKMVSPTTNDDTSREVEQGVIPTIKRLKTIPLLLCTGL